VLDAQAAREITGPPAVDGIGPSDRLEEYWQDFDANRRRKSAWG
jgi:phthalate 4,5-dioxygenase oxygenase subunit